MPSSSGTCSTRRRIIACWNRTFAQALSGDGLALAYQPIIDAESGEVVAREALLRWRHPKRGDIPPDQFIPIIEDAGLIHQIGDWVIREACAEAASWDGDMRVAVNISAAQLSGAGLARTVLGALAATRLEPSRLELEVTESVFLGDDAATLASLERLRALGRSPGARRFRQGIQLVRLFEPGAIRQDQDRPKLCPRGGRGRQGMRRDRPRHPRAGPRTGRRNDRRRRRNRRLRPR